MISCPSSTSRRSDGTADSGVPMKTMRILFVAPSIDFIMTTDGQKQYFFVAGFGICTEIKSAPGCRNQPSTPMSRLICPLVCECGVSPGKDLRRVVGVFVVPWSLIADAGGPFV